MPEQDLDANNTSVAQAAEGSAPSAEAVKDGQSAPVVADQDEALAKLVRKTAAKSSGSSPEQTEKAEGDAPAAKEESGEGTELEAGEGESKDDTDKALPFNDHPRWKQVLAERDAAKSELEKLQPMADSAKAFAEGLAKSGLTQEDVAMAVEVMSLARTDVGKFRAKLQEYIDQVDFATGARLPNDLQKKVDEGTIALEDAKELASLRLAKGQSSVQVKSLQQSQAEQNQKACVAAIDAWEEQVAKSDPAYKAKKPLVQDAFVALCAAKPPQNAADAVALAKQAYQRATEAIRQLTPKPPPRKVLKTNGSSRNGETEGLEMKELTRDSVGAIVRAVAARHAH